MRCSQVVRTLLILSAVAPQLFAGDPFRDEFNDASTSDGQPVSWGVYTSPFNKGTFAQENGDLVLRPYNFGPTSSDPDYWEVDAYVKNQLYHDVSVVTRLRGLNAGPSAVGIGALDTEATLGPSGNGVYFSIITDGTTRLQYGFSVGTDNSNGNVPTALSHQTGDLNLRMDIVGQTVAMKAWPEGTAEPVLPSLVKRLPDALRDATGHVTVWAGSRATIVPAAFRYVDVTPDLSTRGSIVVLPRIEQSVRDTMDDGALDGQGDILTTALNSARIGEHDEESNFMERLVQKYELPKSPNLAARLQKATLRLHVPQIIGPPTEGLSVFHNRVDNSFVVGVSDFQNPDYLDTQLDVLQASDPSGFYEVDVTSQVLSDLLQDPDSPVSAFRFQVTDGVHPEDQVNRYFQVSGTANSQRLPLLVLTMVPEPGMAPLLGSIAPCILWWRRSRRRPTTMPIAD